MKRILGLVVAALCISTASCSRPYAARRADLFGRATLQRDQAYAFKLATPASRIGPGRLLVGGRAIVVTSDTPLYGGCAMFEARLESPCFVQVGLQPGTDEAKWVLGLYVVGPDRTALPTLKGKVRRVTSTTIEFADGSVVPYRSVPTVTGCGSFYAVPGREVELHVDAGSGEAETIKCLVLA